MISCLMTNPKPERIESSPLPRSPMRLLLSRGNTGYRRARPRRSSRDMGRLAGSSTLTWRRSGLNARTYLLSSPGQALSRANGDCSGDRRLTEAWHSDSSSLPAFLLSRGSLDVDVWPKHENHSHTIIRCAIDRSGRSFERLSFNSIALAQRAY
jgi:hypothetical protein